MTSLLRIALHAASIGIMTYGFCSLEELGMHEFIAQQKGGHFQFLTIQGLALTWITMVSGLVLDIFPRWKNVRKFKRAFLMMSLPLTFVITSIYWSLILLFPNLILMASPPESTPDSTSAPTAPETPNFYRIPLKVDLALHAVPLVAAFSDFMFFERKYSKSEALFLAPVVTLAFSTWYGWWVEYCASFNGRFPYPFLTDNPFDIRLKIYGVVTVIALVAFWTLNALHPRSR